MPFTRQMVRAMAHRYYAFCNGYGPYSHIHEFMPRNCADLFIEFFCSDHGRQWLLPREGEPNGN